MTQDRLSNIEKILTATTLAGSITLVMTNNEICDLVSLEVAGLSALGLLGAVTYRISHPYFASEENEKSHITKSYSPLKVKW